MIDYTDTIVATSVEEKVAKKLHKHLMSLGLECRLIPDGTMDFEYDYPRSSLNGPTPGIASRGVIKTNGDIDYIDILKDRKSTRLNSSH